MPPLSYDSFESNSMFRYEICKLYKYYYTPENFCKHRLNMHFKWSIVHYLFKYLGYIPKPYTNGRNRFPSSSPLPVFFFFFVMCLPIFYIHNASAKSSPIFIKFSGKLSKGYPKVIKHTKAGPIFKISSQKQTMSFMYDFVGRVSLTHL